MLLLWKEREDKSGQERKVPLPESRDDIMHFFMITLLYFDTLLPIIQQGICQGSPAEMRRLLTVSLSNLIMKFPPFHSVHKRELWPGQSNCQKTPKSLQNPHKQWRFSQTSSTGSHSSLHWPGLACCVMGRKKTAMWSQESACPLLGRRLKLSFLFLLLCKSPHSVERKLAPPPQNCGTLQVDYQPWHQLVVWMQPLWSENSQGTV